MSQAHLHSGCDVLQQQTLVSTRLNQKYISGNSMQPCIHAHITFSKMMQQNVTCGHGNAISMHEHYEGFEDSVQHTYCAAFGFAIQDI